MGLLRNIIEQLEKLDSKPTSAATAKNRLQILVNQTHRDANAPDYMPRLRSELLEVATMQAIELAIAIFTAIASVAPCASSIAVRNGTISMPPPTPSRPARKPAPTPSASSSTSSSTPPSQSGLRLCSGTVGMAGSVPGIRSVY